MLDRRCDKWLNRDGLLTLCENFVVRSEFIYVEVLGPIGTPHKRKIENHFLLGKSNHSPYAFLGCLLNESKQIVVSKECLYNKLRSSKHQLYVLQNLWLELFDLRNLLCCCNVPKVVKIRALETSLDPSLRFIV